MVEEMVVMLAAFLLGMCIGVLFFKREKSVQPAEKTRTPVLDNFKFWKPDPPTPPKDYPVESIPRTSGPWRRQKQALEASHNSKQKERDALSGGKA